LGCEGKGARVIRRLAGILLLANAVSCAAGVFVIGYDTDPLVAIRGFTGEASMSLLVIALLLWDRRA
jgi:hypothetical protein